MNTSGTGTVFTIGYWVVLATTLACAGLLLGDLRLRLRAPRPAALALVAVVAVPSLTELGWHGIYTALYRAPDQIRQHHQYWRLLTGSIVQDGGWKARSSTWWSCSSSPPWPATPGARCGPPACSGPE